MAIPLTNAKHFRIIKILRSCHQQKPKGIDLLIEKRPKAA
jgi:hypothetical protein